MRAQITEIQVWDLPSPNGAIVGYTLTLQVGDVVEIVGWCRQTRDLACRVEGFPFLLLGLSCPVIGCDPTEPLTPPQDSRNEETRVGTSTTRRLGRGTDGLTAGQRDLLARIQSAGPRGLAVSRDDVRVGKALLQLRRVAMVNGRRKMTLQLRDSES